MSGRVRCSARCVCDVQALLVVPQCGQCLLSCSIKAAGHPASDDSPATQAVLRPLGTVPDLQEEHVALAPPAEKALPVQVMQVPFIRPEPAEQPAR